MHSLKLLPLLCLLAACSTRPLSSEETASFDTAMDAPQEALAAIDSSTLRQRIEYLSADRLQGRGTGMPGEQLAVEYISEQMKQAGLEPAGDDGTFFQSVPLLGSTPHPQTPLVLRAEDGQTLRLDFLKDYIVSTDLEAEHVSTTGQLVFVGYGIDAPEYDWHDFKDLDVEGKILVSFVNDPKPIPGEPNLFQADTLTYYGRWTYKYEEVRRRGAKGMLLIHTTPTASYPFTVLSGSAASEQVQLATPPPNALEMKGWITEDRARQLAEMAGTTLEDWFQQANTRAFQPQVLPITASIDVDYTVRRFDGTNVIGKLPGRTRPDEAVIYTAHHDHLGIATPVNGDSIYNGAVDNATGVAMVLTLADAFSGLPQPPERTVLFATLTAEEHGLLGSEYYALHPSIPLKNTVANINVDSGNIHGRTSDIVGIGAERSDMLRLLETSASAEDMTVTPNANPNAGGFFRSDQLAFARSGVPAVFLETGSHFIGRPDDYARQLDEAYTSTHYHQPSDEFDPSWPMSGLIQQTRVAFRMGYQLANSTLAPQWKPGEAFARAREE
ncbi:MAG TPA: M28 family peptidase [Rhodothermales bacterium]|nr:M28 family peptidase [Rhodothermales bacterium]